MNVIWFLILGAMLVGYAVLDGFDLGVGAILPWIARNEEERLTVRASIGPIWNGNEVWLIAAGGAMFMAFPRLYAASFSGFYLALMLVLWLLIARGVGLEFRHAQKDPMWATVWDFSFVIASILLAALYGVAVGNVLRGVPLGADGYFQGSFGLMLNPFAILGGVLSLVTLMLHGATFLIMKTEGDLQRRARKFASVLWIACAVLAAAFGGASFFARPDFGANFHATPVLLIMPLLAAAAIVAVPTALKSGKDAAPFLATSGLIMALLGSAAAGLFPRLLPALIGNPQYDLTIYNAATTRHGLFTALILNLLGMTGVIGYNFYVHKVWSGKVRDVHY